MGFGPTPSLPFSDKVRKYELFFFGWLPLHQICVSTQHSWLGRTYIKRDSLSEQDCSGVDGWVVMIPEVKLHMQSKSLVLKISIVWDSCQNIQNEFKLWRHLPECISVV